MQVLRYGRMSRAMAGGRRATLQTQIYKGARSMSLGYLEYPLDDDYIHHWLVAGPEAIPLPEHVGGPLNEKTRLELAQRYCTEEPDVELPAAERNPVRAENASLVWRVLHCREDHLVDLTTQGPTRDYLRSWAYTRIVSPISMETTFALTTNGPTDIWLDQQHICGQDRFSEQACGNLLCRASLRQGENEILVRFEKIALSDCPYIVSLRISHLHSSNSRILLPTNMAQVSRRQAYERVFEQAHLEREVYGSYDDITVRWPSSMKETAQIALRLQDPLRHIYVEAWPTAQASASVNLAKGVQVPEGPLDVVLMPRPNEYYVKNLRIQRHIRLQVAKCAYSGTPYGSYEDRRREVLEYAARQDHDLYAQVARMELGLWSTIDTATITEAVDEINERCDASAHRLLGLSGMLHRYADNPLFPEDLERTIEKCVLDFKYQLDRPGCDSLCYPGESHEIVLHACEILAGQLFAHSTFADAARMGEWHRARGEQLALSWLIKAGRSGFREWDSNSSFPDILLALSHLADFAENNAVCELAAVVMDKIFFSMAVNSFRGTFGSTHGSTCSAFVKSGRLESTAGISRLMWGMGLYNQHIAGMVALACSREYEFPPIIADIACHLPEEMWSRERHTAGPESSADRSGDQWEVNKVTCKTPDYMLASAQDYYPGEKGNQEHIWQATMGPDAVVFATHPACMSEQAPHRPNFWRGNRMMPRVAQWHNFLIALYRLPENDPLGFTHAYFPIYAFDEYALHENWAFARKGQGYLALRASHGLHLVTKGLHAYRELRSYGDQHVWLCHMGRAALDGSFDQFQRKISSLGVSCEGLSARCSTLRGHHVALDWQGPFLVDGKPRAISGFKHYDNPYCVAELPSSRMEIRFGEWLMRLHFTG